MIQSGGGQRGKSDDLFRFRFSGVKDCFAFSFSLRAMECGELTSFVFISLMFFFLVCLLVLFVFASIKQLTIVFFCFYTFNCCLNWFCVVVFLFFFASASSGRQR